MPHPLFTPEIEHCIRSNDPEAMREFSEALHPATIAEALDGNFKVEDTENKIFHYIKRYLAIFGTINHKDVDCDFIINCFTDI